MPGINYEPPPTCKKFMNSEAYGRLLAGPVGSGKTTACIMEFLRRAIEQEPGTDGFSYTQFAIVRQTLKQLKDTVLTDVKSWFRGIGEWKVSEGAFHLNFDRVRSKWYFLPLETEEDQGRLLSMNLTGAWLSECIEMDISVIGPISGRLGRYPNENEAGSVPTWHGMIADTNFPAELTPWHKFMTEPLKNWEIFQQPGGLTPDAENLAYLLQNAETRRLHPDHPERLAQGRRYYERFVETYGGDSDWVKRYVHAQFGDDPSGLAIFRTSFKKSFHCVDDTLVIPGYPLIVGQDFGRDPWSVICQPDHMGRLIVHAEVGAENIGLEKHVNEHLKPRLLSEKFFGTKVAVVGDPSGIAKGTIAEESCFDALKRMGLPAFPAPSNDIEPRLRAVEALLLRQTNGEPTLVINKKECPTLVRALDGGYRYGKTKAGQRKTQPDKNEFSHVADALQYACMVAHGGLIGEISRRLMPRSASKRPSMSSAAWT